MDQREINVLQLIEKLLESILKEEKLRYVPLYTMHMDADKTNYSISPAITSCVISVAKDISGSYRSHIEEVLSILSTGKCDKYVNLLGFYALKEKQFKWSLFRAFLAFVCLLCGYSFRKGDLYLTDELIVNFTKCIETKLLKYTGCIETWKAFELDCVKTVLRKEHCKLHQKLQYLNLECKKKQEKIENVFDVISSSGQRLLQGQSYRKPQCSGKKDKVITITFDPESPEADFTFAESFVDRNTAAKFSKRHSTGSFPSELLDYYDLEVEDDRVTRDFDLIVFVISSSIKALREI